jgi:hypothetical protein
VARQRDGQVRRAGAQEAAEPIGCTGDTEAAHCCLSSGAESWQPGIHTANNVEICNHASASESKE